MSAWDTYQRLLKMQKDGCSPYRDEMFIVDSPIADEKLETTIMHFRNLVDNYSRVFCCLLAKFYETLLIQIYEYVDLDVMELARTRLNERFDIENSDGETTFDADNDFEMTIEDGLQCVVAEDGSFDYLYDSVGAIANIAPRLFENFAKEMASIELEYLYSGLEFYERNDLQEAVVQKFGELLEIDYTASGSKLKDYNLNVVLEYLGEMNDPTPMFK